MKPVYVCTGGCGGKVTTEAYAAGKTTCGTLTCPKYSQPFESRHECDTCGEVLMPEASTHHEQKHALSV